MNPVLGGFNEDKECRRTENTSFLLQKVGHGRRLEVGEVKRFVVAHKNREMDGDV